MQKVTGRPLAEVVTDRVIEPLHLRDTYVPDRGEEELRERHPLGYHAAEPGGELRDITVLDPSWAWGAGDIVSTPSDLDAFFVALLGGELLPPELLAEMQTTVETAPELNGMRYGLGALQHPAELRRRRLGARRQHPRVRDRRRRRAGRPVGDRRGDRAAGGDGRPRGGVGADQPGGRRGALRVAVTWPGAGPGAATGRPGRRREPSVAGAQPDRTEARRPPRRASGPGTSRGGATAASARQRGGAHPGPLVAEERRARPRADQQPVQARRGERPVQRAVEHEPDVHDVAERSSPRPRTGRRAGHPGSWRPPGRRPITWVADPALGPRHVEVVTAHAERHGGADVGRRADQRMRCQRDGGGRPPNTRVASTAPLSERRARRRLRPSGRSLPSTPCISRSSTVHTGTRRRRGPAGRAGAAGRRAPAPARRSSGGRS